MSPAPGLGTVVTFVHLWRDPDVHDLPLVQQFRVTGCSANRYLIDEAVPRTFLGQNDPDDLRSWPPGRSHARRYWLRSQWTEAADPQMHLYPVRPEYLDDLDVFSTQRGYAHEVRNLAEHGHLRGLAQRVFQLKIQPVVALTIMPRWDARQLWEPKVGGAVVIDADDWWFALQEVTFELNRLGDIKNVRRYVPPRPPPPSLPPITITVSRGLALHAPLPRPIGPTATALLATPVSAAIQSVQSAASSPVSEASESDTRHFSRTMRASVFFNRTPFRGAGPRGRGRGIPADPLQQPTDYPSSGVLTGRVERSAERGRGRTPGGPSSRGRNGIARGRGRGAGG